MSYVIYIMCCVVLFELGFVVIVVFYRLHKSLHVCFRYRGTLCLWNKKIIFLVTLFFVWYHYPFGGMYVEFRIITQPFLFH